MAFTVAELIVQPRWDTTRLAGTLMPTRTPAGVSLTRQPPVSLAASDRVSIEIEGVGHLTKPMEAA